MPDQEEELRLTVTLVDNASAGLDKLKEQLRDIGGGSQGQQHLQKKFRKETQELSATVKKMSGGLDESYKSLGMMRSGLAAGGAALALFGFELMRQSKALIEYSDKIRALNQAARQIGVSPAQLKDVTEQLEAFGVKGDEAVASIGAVSAKIAELQRTGSQLRLDLMRGAGQDPQAVRNMEQYLDRLKNARDISEQLNIIRQGGEDVYRHALEQTHSEQEAANRRNTFWAQQGYDARLAEAGKLKEMTAAERRLAEQRQNNAEALSNEWAQIGKKYDTLVETMENGRSFRICSPR